MKLSALLGMFAVCLIPNYLCGDVVSYSVSGSVIAELANVTSLTDSLTGDVDSSTLILNGTGGTQNSITTSSLSYSWDGSSLTGSGLIETEKTIPAKPGGLHHGESTLSFNFSIDEISTYSLNGNFGYVGVTASDAADNVSWSLTGTPLSGPNYTASGTANAVSDTTVHEQVFSASDTISAGIYTLVLTGDFHETVNSPESRLAGWEITSFTVAPVAPVPESTSFVVLGWLALASLHRRRTRRNP